MHLYPFQICNEWDKREILTDKKILACGFGIGLSWGITNLYIKTNTYISPVLEI